MIDHRRRRRRPGDHALRRHALGVLMAVATWTTACHEAVSAETFRCTVDGRTTYSDVPCRSGVQRTVDLPSPAVQPADRAAAQARAETDRLRLAELDRGHAKELAEDRRAAAAAARHGSDRSRQAHACDQLRRAARRAHDDFAVAGPRDQARTRLRMLRADEDFAALCRPRR